MGRRSRGEWAHWHFGIDNPHLFVRQHLDLFESLLIVQILCGMQSRSQRVVCHLKVPVGKGAAAGREELIECSREVVQVSHGGRADLSRAAAAL